MTDQPKQQLMDRPQLAALRAAFHRGSAVASQALAKWIGKPTVVEIDSFEQLPFEEATGLLTLDEAATNEPICFCATEMNGLLTGEMVLAFDDASGLALTDMLLDNSSGTTVEWTEVAISAAEETTNILCCAYLGSLCDSLSSDGSCELLPSPPRFSRDFAECLLEFAVMGQAVASDQILLARTRFEIDRMPVQWTLLFVPDAPSMARLPQLLTPLGKES